MDSSIVDTWVVAEDGIAMGKSVVDGVKFVTVERIIKMGDGVPEMAVMPFARGEELDRLIAALQRARDGEGKAASPICHDADLLTIAILDKDHALLANV